MANFVGSIAAGMAMDRQRELHHKLSTSSFGAFSDGSGGVGGAYSSSPPKLMRAGASSPHSALKATSNMAFNPIPTTPGKSNKLKINVLLDSTIYVAGGNLHGRMELVSSSHRSLKLGEIAVELNGFEEVSDKDYARSQAFLAARIVFQGDRMPPSNAVRGPGENGYWQANKGKTTFPFAFRLPADAPSSYSFQNLASLRYVVSGVVQYKHGGKSDSLFRSKEAFVVESWSQAHPRTPDEPIRAKNHRRVWFGGAGEVHIEGTIQKSYFCSGNDVYVELRVRNESRRRVQGIKLSLMRKLLMLKEGTAAKDLVSDTKIVSEIVAEKTFKEKDFVFDAGEERANILNIHIPRSVRTCKNTALAEVACRVMLSLNMGTFNKDLVVELPINVCHSASILPPPTIDMDANMHPQHYNVISDDPDHEAYPKVRTRNKDWKATLRARSASPPRTLRGGPVAPPQGRRALPWSDDEGDVQEFVTRRRARNPGSVAARAAEGANPPGGFLRDLAPNSPAIATLRGIPSKGNLAKSPPLGPATPVSYVPAAERSKYLSVRSGLLQIPGSPTQEMVTPTSPQEWGGGPASPIDNLALPSPVIKGKRSPLAASLYDPPTPPNQYSARPPTRNPRPLPVVPPVPSSPTWSKDEDVIPIQYRTKSPPLKPRPVNYVSRANRDTKPLPKVSDSHFLMPEPKNNKARFSAQSQVSTIVGAESNFLDIDFDFGEDFIEGKTSPLSKHKGKQMGLSENDREALAKKENAVPRVKKPSLIDVATKPNSKSGSQATSPRAISSKLEGCE
ncbi:hypothetical protein DFJ77DRAFT_101717 [Powellomyces hirtus]|nr:hypothetical protein DFJ77DRAFT_101717 [Powellomyces hirtus]